MEKFYLITSSVKKIDHLTKAEAIEACCAERGKGLRSEILSYEQAKKLGFLSPMQDLTTL
jgi:hypothetical protein